MDGGAGERNRRMNEVREKEERKEGGGTFALLIYESR